MTAARKPSTIDDYLESVPEDRRGALDDLRAKIRSIVPDAEEYSGLAKFWPVM